MSRTQFCAIPMWIHALVRQGKLTYSEGSVLVALFLDAKALGDTGVALVTAESLARDWRGAKTRTVEVALKTLAEKGFIRRFITHGSNGKSYVVIDGYLLPRRAEERRLNAQRTDNPEAPAYDTFYTDKAGAVDTAEHDAPPAAAPGRDCGEDCADDRGEDCGALINMKNRNRRPKNTTPIAPAGAVAVHEGGEHLHVSADDVARLFSRLLPALPQPRRPLSAGIASKVRAAIRRHPDLAWWEEFFVTVQQRPFLMGSNDRGWQATLTWLCLPRAEDGIAEGRYRGGTKGDAMMNNARQAAADLAGGATVDDLPQLPALDPETF